MDSNVKPKLSIFSPSHYSAPLNYVSLFNLIDIAQKEKRLEVIISDNSNDPEKNKLFDPFKSDNIKIIQGPEKENYYNALKHTRGDFVLACGDDDLIFTPGLNVLLSKIDQGFQNKSIDSPDFVGWTGLFANRKKYATDIFEYNNFSSNLIYERTINWLKFIPNGNPIFHSVIKRDIALKAWDFWRSIPHPQHCDDQLMTLFLCSSGSFDYLDQLYFIYNATNWGDKDNIIHSELKMWESNKESYPVSFIPLQRLALAIHGFYLIKKFGLCKSSEKPHSALAWLSTWIGYWKNSWLSSYFEIPVIQKCQFFTKAKNLTIKYYNASQVSPSELLRDISLIYDEFDGSGTSYREFWTQL